MPRFSLFQWFVHIAAWVPAALIVFDSFTHRLTFNPIQDLTFRTGKTALVLLVLSLACTPVNTLFGFREAIKVRRALGVYAFLYVVGHLGIFIFDYALTVDNRFDLNQIWLMIVEKRYVLAGFSAFLILLPLAITSFQWWMKKLGKKWKALHRGVYLAGLLAVIHYLWLVKSDIREPLFYGGIVILLLVLRLPAVRERASKLRARVTSWWRQRNNPRVAQVDADKGG